jgi:AGZA family xanthine/uracil permease-like MFS transporter
MSWQVALTCCFVQGILFAILSLLGVCSLIQQLAPGCIKKSITVGLGLFQALIGFDMVHLVVRGDDVLLSELRAAIV